jgi:hypothetical protein
MILQVVPSKGYMNRHISFEEKENNDADVFFGYGLQL